MKLVIHINFHSKRYLLFINVYIDYVKNVIKYFYHNIQDIDAAISYTGVAPWDTATNLDMTIKSFVLDSTKNLIIIISAQI